MNKLYTVTIIDATNLIVNSFIRLDKYLMSC